MKLRDLWPAILTAPLLALPIIDWSSEQDSLARTTEVLGHITRVAKYKCSSGSYRDHCYEFTVTYKSADGREHRADKYRRTGAGPAPQVGDSIRVLVNTSTGGSIPDGTLPGSAAAGARFGTLLALGMFSLGCYASWTRIQRRRTNYPAPPG